MVSHSASIKQLENEVGKISMQFNNRSRGGLLSDMIYNLKNDTQVLKIVTRSGEST